MNLPPVVTKPCGLPILTFHSFRTSRAVTSTEPSWFNETLHMLGENGWHCVDLEDWVARGRPEEPRGFSIAIDDGLCSLLTIIDILKRHDATATVFLVTDRIGLDNAWQGQPAWVPIEPVLSWSEVAGLKNSPLRFAAHGATHARLDRCKPAEIIDEVRGSRDAIEDRTGRPCPLLAYPYGTANPDVREVASRYFHAAFGTRLDLADSTQDRFSLPRIDAFYLRAERSRRALVENNTHRLLRRHRALRAVKEGAVSFLERWAS